VLLSGLVFPGLGQFVNGAYLKGLAFAGGTLAVLVALVHRVVRETLPRLPTDPLEIDVGLPFRLAVEIQRDNATFFFWMTLTVAGLWAGAMADAWRDARRR
jgi:hypothetical protein